MAHGEVCQYNKGRELLAQGLSYAKNMERSQEQERAERQRQLPYHMHINLEVQRPALKDVENFREMFNCQNAEMCWVIWTRTNISWVSEVSLSNIFQAKKFPGHRSRRCRRCWRVRSTSAPCCWRCQTSPCRRGMTWVGCGEMMNLCFQVELPTFCWNMLKSEWD